MTDKHDAKSEPMTALDLAEMWDNSRGAPRIREIRRERLAAIPADAPEQIAALKAEVADLRDEAEEVREQTERAMKGQCGYPDEVHCTCRPTLLRAIGKQNAKIARLKCELKDAERMREKHYEASMVSNATINRERHFAGVAHRRAVEAERERDEAAEQHVTMFGGMTRERDALLVSLEKEVILREKAEASLAEAHLAYAKQSTDVEQLYRDRDRLAAENAGMVGLVQHLRGLFADNQEMGMTSMQVEGYGQSLDNALAEREPRTARVQQIVKAAGPVASILAERVKCADWLKAEVFRLFIEAALGEGK